MCFFSPTKILDTPLTSVYVHVLCYYVFCVAILLGHLRTPVEELKKDILTMECRRLSVAHIQQLAQYAPDTDEVNVYSILL